MSDWNKPTITSNYITFVDEVKNRDVDAITLQLNAVTNPPLGAVKMSRSPVKFQEWDGTQFVDRVLSIAGGGTGASTLSGLGSAMGLGTMAYQNANAVAITGGSANGISLLNPSVSGAYNGVGTFSQGGYIYVSNTDQNYHGLHVVQNRSQLFSGVFDNSSTSQSMGLLVRAGNDKNDIALQVINRLQTVNYLHVRGDGFVQIPFFLRIPVGVNKFVTA